MRPFNPPVLQAVHGERGVQRHGRDRGRGRLPACPALLGSAGVRQVSAIFSHFGCFELEVRGHTSAQGAAFSCLRLKLADVVAAFDGFTAIFPPSGPPTLRSPSCRRCSSRGPSPGRRRSAAAWRRVARRSATFRPSAGTSEPRSTALTCPGVVRPLRCSAGVRSCNRLPRSASGGGAPLHVI